MSHPKAILRGKRADILASYRHPWVFSKGLAKKPECEAGTQVQVASQDGRHLGWAFYHPRNPICLRMVSFDKRVEEAGWRERIRAAYDLRRRLLPGEEGYRLIHGENDGFPGLTVDRYGALLCLQITTAGMESLKQDMARWLCEETGAEAVYEISEGYARKQEGLTPSQGFLTGSCTFPLEIKEHGLCYRIDPSSSQKTGFYLDQRAQRAWVERHAQGLRVLDLCCYSGGFSLAALRGGAARVLSVDSSAHALELLQTNLEINGLADDRHSSLRTNIFEYLKTKPEEVWDLVILDPPSLAKSLQVRDRALNSYRQLHRHVAPWLDRGGQLLTFSCTGVVNRHDFRHSVFLGLRDAHREAVITGQFGAGPDHPVNLRFPEGEYLKGLSLYLH